MNPPPSSPDGVTAESLIRTLTHLSTVRCGSCQGPLCHHQALMSIYLGFKHAPRCLGCMAESLGVPTVDLRDRLMDNIQQRDCYREAWEWASRDEGFVGEMLPACLANA